MCDLEAIGAPSILRVIHNAAALARMMDEFFKFAFRNLFTTFQKNIYLFVYYESIKRELKIRGIYECRCDERLQTKTKEFTRLPYTGLVLELEHLKIETRLISERFANAMGECEN